MDISLRVSVCVERGGVRSSARLANKYAKLLSFFLVFFF